jgi:hypothetical protein
VIALPRLNCVIDIYGLQYPVCPVNGEMSDVLVTFFSYDVYVMSEELVFPWQGQEEEADEPILRLRRVLSH